MKITICGSIAFQDEVLSVKEKLEKLGHEVKVWPLKLEDGKGQLISAKEYYKIRKIAADDEKWVWDRKAEAVLRHFNKVDWSDAILVANYDKNDVKGYIGGNTLMEMGLAFFLKNQQDTVGPASWPCHNNQVLPVSEWQEPWTAEHQSCRMNDPLSGRRESLPEVFCATIQPPAHR